MKIKKDLQALLNEYTVAIAEIQTAATPEEFVHISTIVESVKISISDFRMANSNSTQTTSAAAIEKTVLDDVAILLELSLEAFVQKKRRINGIQPAGGELEVLSF